MTQFNKIPLTEVLMFYADHFEVEPGKKIKSVDWFIDQRRNVVIFEIELDDQVAEAPV